ncbi:hypothetical protein AB0D57_42395 [Streptomyces sp. NPDC048275]|uniref:hypothetical protein n=1 Tax=Streptomyces sp. NPDC048275 TaxID=3155629 RepID=UPI0034029201
MMHQGEPLISAEALEWLPAEWLLQAGTRTLAHLQAEQWRPDADDRRVAAAVRDFLNGDTPGPQLELTEGRLERLEQASVFIGRTVDTDTMTPLLAELLLAFGRALLPWRPPKERGAWEPKPGPYQPGSLGAITRNTKYVRGAAVQVLERIAASTTNGEPVVPHVAGRSGHATHVWIHQDDKVVSSMLPAKCPDCGNSEQLLLTTDFRHLELTCRRGHPWTDHRITVSGWALGPTSEDVFTMVSTRGIRPLGEVHIRYTQ